MQVITNFKEGTIYQPIPEDKIIQFFEEKNPKPEPCKPIVGKPQPLQQQFENITIEELKTVISMQKDHKAQGPSGWANAHLKYLAESHEGFLKQILSVFNKLINNPECVTQIHNLYKFRPVFIPKKDNGIRPLAICEPMLLVFHKLLTNRLAKQITLNKRQMAF